MKLRIFTLTLLITLIASIQIATAVQVFTVLGSVKNPDGTFAENGLIITVTNITRDLTVETTLDDVSAEKFSATFFNWDKSVAEVGDQLTVTAEDSDGKMIAQIAYQLTADDLSDFLATIDLQISAVEIESVSVSPPIAKTGDTLFFTLIGSPEQTASVSVESVASISKMPLSERVPAGTYTASYTVKDGDDVSEGTVLFQLSSQTYTSQKLTIDTIPPAAPIELQVVGGKIDQENVDEVVITAIATQSSRVTVTLTDSAGNSVSDRATASSSGKIELTLDANGLIDGEITVTAQQDPDFAGNIGEISTTTVEKSTPRPDFSISTSQSNQTVQVSNSVTFTVLLSGRNEFYEIVNLSVDESTLPSGCEAAFEPSSVQPSETETTKTSLLTIATSGTTPAGTHTIRLIAGSAKINKMIEITLNVDKSQALITINLSPEGEIPFQEQLEVFGQVSLQDEPANRRINLPITLKMIDPDGTESEKNLSTNASRVYRDESISLDKIGTWTIVATWEGDEKYEQIFAVAGIEVVKGFAMIDWMAHPVSVNPKTAEIGRTVTIALQINPVLEDASIILTISKPEQIADEQLRLATDAYGVAEIEIMLDIDGSWGFTAEWEGDANYRTTTSTTHRIDAIRELGKAIIVLGGGNEDVNINWRRFQTTAEHVYKTLTRRRLTDDDIFYLSPSTDPSAMVDETTSEYQLGRAITRWANEQVNANVPLLIYLLSHNSGSHFLLEKTAHTEILLSAEKLASWLNEIPEEVPVTVIIEACYSANFIPIIAGENRVVLTSTNTDNQAQIYRSSSFSRFFFENIRGNKTVRDAFSDTADRMSMTTIHSAQNPRIDATGNGKPNEVSDFEAVKNVFIPDDIESLTKPSMTDLNATPNELSEGLTASLISVRVPGDVPIEVSAMVVPPDFDPTKQFDEWIEFDTFELTDPDSDRVFVGTHGQFTKNGDYTIVVNATDEFGNNAEPLQTVITVISEPIELRGDVNGSGKVDIFDLVMVGSQFGQIGKDLSGDVDGNGKVDIFDLVMVGAQFGESASAAPSVETKNLASLQIIDLIHALEVMPNRSEGAEVALRVLRELLRLAQDDKYVILNEMKNLIPDHTRLLPNYPNPFNPETWIPFELAVDAEVTIEIFDVSGRLLRRLKLGDHQAGSYRSPEKAAYWDGRDGQGERVASGVYFVKMIAGEFVQTRRLVVLK